MATAAFAEFRFDAAEHRYYLGDERLISVTQALQGVGLIDTSWFSEWAAWRGSVVHACCQFDDEGTLKESSVDPRARPYLEAWRQWKRDVDFKPRLIEKALFHPDLKYAGTIDRVGSLGPWDEAIIDLKTGVAAKWHGAQLAAYSGLLPSPRRYKRFTVRLQPDGTYVMTEYPLRTWGLDWNAFNAALALHNWRTIHGC